MRRRRKSSRIHLLTVDDVTQVGFNRTRHMGRVLGNLNKDRAAISYHVCQVGQLAVQSSLLSLRG